MSIRAIARDLYKAQQTVERLERAFEASAPAEQEVLGGELRLARKELEMIKKILEGEKESSSFRNKFRGFKG